TCGLKVKCATKKGTLTTMLGEEVKVKQSDLNVIRLELSNANIKLIHHLQTLCAMLEYLERQYAATTTNDRVDMCEELMSMKYKPLTDMTTHLGEMQGLITRLHGMTLTAGQTEEHIVFILGSLPASDNWKTLVTMLRSMSNLTGKELTLDTVVTEVTKHIQLKASECYQLRFMTTLNHVPATTAALLAMSTINAEVEPETFRPVSQRTRTSTAKAVMIVELPVFPATLRSVPKYHLLLKTFLIPATALPSVATSTIIGPLILIQEFLHLIQAC
ncbi:hypothetical protein HDU99_002328, partial [Rhizoclosmatium hyalinum]